MPPFLPCAGMLGASVVGPDSATDGLIAARPSVDGLPGKRTEWVAIASLKTGAKEAK